MDHADGQETVISTVSIGADHAGYPMKAQLAQWLTDHGYQVINRGTDSTDSTDYPDYAHAVAGDVSSGDADLGLLVCGSGIGMSIAANQHPGIRAALCANSELAGLSRMHNNANVLCLAARFITDEVAESALETFLNTPFEGGRHERRVEKMTP